VNGKDYFGGDVQTATKNLPADIIDNIQIIDDYGDRANLTGVKEGEPEKIMNINIKKGKNKGLFGNGTVAGGTQERYGGNVSANYFKEERQISFLGSINNTNANLFNFNGGGRGGGARGANLGGGNRGGSGGDGNTVAKSFGFNYRDKWSEKLSSYGSYSYSGNNTSVNGSSFARDLNPLNIRTTSRESNRTNQNDNHRLTWNLEYKINPNNYLKITPYFSSGTSHSANEGHSNIISEKTGTIFYTDNQSRQKSDSKSPSGGGDIFYNHKFNNPRRNISFNAGLNYSSNNQNNYAWNRYQDSSNINPIATDSIRNQFILTNALNTSSEIRVTYNEPIGKFTTINTSYAYNKSTTNSLRETNDINAAGEKNKNELQSNDYDYSFVTHKFALNLNTWKTKYNFQIGMTFQPSELIGKDNSRHLQTQFSHNKFSPTARFTYNFAKNHTLTANYGTSGREPNFMQLQPVPDSSNSKNIMVGNPDLKPEFTNRFNLTYNKAGILTGESFFSNISFNQTENKIVRSTQNNVKGTGRSTTYINTNGFYSVDGNVSYTKPFSDRKFSATIGTSGNFNNNISFTDNQKNNGQYWSLTPSARFRADIKDLLDISLNGSYSLSTTLTKFATSTNKTEVKTTRVGLNGKNFFLKNWTVGYQATKIYYAGFTGAKVANPLLLNLYLERRFLKGNAATLRLQAFDLLNENTGIERTVNGTTITDSQNDRLGRYFLLSFNLRLQKFKGKQPSGRRGNYRRQGME
jgi:outer membrane receptor protein involved in Fe transport